MKFYHLVITLFFFLYFRFIFGLILHVQRRDNEMFCSTQFSFDRCIDNCINIQRFNSKKDFISITFSGLHIYIRFKSLIQKVMLLISNVLNLFLSQES